MFFKTISALLAAGLGYYIYQNGFDSQQTAYFIMMPIAALFSYLLLGAAD